VDGSIFICYRREDSVAYAGRLHDRLSAHFGRNRVFMDLDTIQPGEDFVDVLERRVGESDVLVAVVGKGWLDSKDEHGSRRLDEADDYVRRELAAALSRKIRVIPALVAGAHMPKSTDLPVDISALSRRNAIEISDTDFNASVAKLIEALESAIEAERHRRDDQRQEARRDSFHSAGEPAGAVASKERASVTSDPAMRRVDSPLQRHWAAIIGVVGVSVVIGMLFVVLGLRGTPPPKPQTAFAGGGLGGGDVTSPGRVPPPPSSSTTTTTVIREQPSGSDRSQQRQSTGEPSNVPLKRGQPPRETPIAPPRTASSSAKPADSVSPVRVGGAIRQPVKLINVNPVYPAIAQAARVQGVVIVELTVGPDGRVQLAKVLRSIPLLDAAALDAVKQWIFSPTLLNGRPVPVIMTVTVNFVLTDPKADVVKYVNRLEAASDVDTAATILRTVFGVDVTPEDRRSAFSVFGSLKLRVNAASEAQLDQIQKMIPK